MAADKPVSYTPDELALIIVALERELDSAKRQQNIKGRTPQMKEIFAKHERTMSALINKVIDHTYLPR